MRVGFSVKIQCGIGYISNLYCPSCGIRYCSLKTKMLRYICRNPEAVSLPCNFRRPKVDIQADFFIKLQCEIWQKSELFRFPVIFVDWKIICEPKVDIIIFFLAPLHNDAIDFEINLKSKTIREDSNRKLFHEIIHTSFIPLLYNFTTF